LTAEAPALLMAGSQDFLKPSKPPGQRGRSTRASFHTGSAAS
jgi:hypothetical protein